MRSSRSDGTHLDPHRCLRGNTRGRAIDSASRPRRCSGWLHRSRGDSQFYTWLYRIAANTAKNYLASRARKSPGYTVDVDDAQHFEGESGLKEYSNPENLLLTEEIKTTIFSAIENLPDDLKSAIILRELDGLSYEEIAEVMDCPIDTVRSRIFPATDVIDKELRPLLE